MPEHLQPRLYAIPGGVLSLSGAALQELLAAVIAKKARFRFRARGFSMDPFIRDGDVLTIAPLEGRAPRLGEVVVFCHPVTQRLLVHRVVARRSGAFLLRGDNAGEPDGLLSAGKILGIVTRRERNGRPACSATQPAVATRQRCGRVRSIAGRPGRLGLWPERVLLALLSRSGLLFRLRRWRESLIGFLSCRLENRVSHRLIRPRRKL